MGISQPMDEGSGMEFTAVQYAANPAPDFGPLARGSGHIVVAGLPTVLMAPIIDTRKRVVGHVAQVEPNLQLDTPEGLPWLYQAVASADQGCGRRGLVMVRLPTAALGAPLWDTELATLDGRCVLEVAQCPTGVLASWAWSLRVRGFQFAMPCRSMADLDAMAGCMPTYVRLSLASSTAWDEVVRIADAVRARGGRCLVDGAGPAQICALLDAMIGPCGSRCRGCRWSSRVH